MNKFFHIGAFALPVTHIKHVAVALTLGLSSSMAQAQSCAHLCDIEWLRAATQAEIDAAIATSNPNARTKDGETPLFFAAIIGNPEIVVGLVDEGADVTARDEQGITALMRAARFGSTEAIKVLLEAGADVNAQNWSEHTALFFAVGGARNEAEKVFLEASEDVNDRHVEAIC